jgi:hypothetical protein
MDLSHASHPFERENRSSIGCPTFLGEYMCAKIRIKCSLVRLQTHSIHNAVRISIPLCVVCLDGAALVHIPLRNNAGHYIYFYVFFYLQEKFDSSSGQTDSRQVETLCILYIYILCHLFTMDVFLFYIRAGDFERKNGNIKRARETFSRCPFLAHSKYNNNGMCNVIKYEFWIIYLWTLGGHFDFSL